jgi:hypothetical protein
MKKTFWITLVVVGLGSVALWTTRAVWRAKNDLVSLHVRNAPIAEVIRQLEGQSRETIVADKELTGSITLDLKNVPLTDALEQVAGQAGGMAGAIHTVYRSDTQLGKLKHALAAGQGPASETWTNLAPNFRLPGFPAAEDEHGGAMPLSAAGRPARIKMLRSEALPPDLERALAEAVKDAGGSNAVAEVEVAATTKAVPGEGPRRSRVMTLRLDGNQLQSGDLDRVLKEQLGINSALVAEAVASALGGMTNGTLPPGTQMRSVSSGPVIAMRRAGPGADGEAETEFWAPERIIMESNLSERLGDNLPETADRAAAEAVAAKVQGRCVTLYALKSSPLLHLPAGSWRHAGPGVAGDRLRLRAGTNGAPDLNRITGEIEARLQRENLEQFQKLTPEQRAERARARQANPSER